MHKYSFLLFCLFVLFTSCEDEKPVPQYILSTTVSPLEGGKITISPQSVSYKAGDVVTLNIETNKNYEFLRWEGDGSGAGTPLQITMNADKSVVGIFIKLEYALDIQIEGEGTVEKRVVTNPGAKVYPSGTVVELTPIPKEGWEFDSWSGDLDGYKVPQNIVIDKEKKVTAKFVIATTKFMLHPNGSTCICPDARPGDKGIINGVTYEAVDNSLIRIRRDQNSDMTKLCTSLVTDMSTLFAGKLITDRFTNTVIWNQFNQPIGNWDVSRVTNMSGMFFLSYFNQSIENWDVSNVTNMRAMFSSAAGNKTPFNQPLSKWNVGKVIDMAQMFDNSSFNQPIGNWNVGKVNFMTGMFGGSPFNQPIGDWDVSSVTDMGGMFTNSSFNQPIGNWNVSKVKSMRVMFTRTPFNQSIENWNVSEVEDMEMMFENTVFNLPIGKWNVSKVRNMGSMFKDSKFNQAIENWDVSKVYRMDEMFRNSAFNHPIGKWVVTGVTDMGSMFKDSAFNQSIDLWDVGVVINMKEMFENSPFNQPIGNWNVRKVKDDDMMSRMFKNSSFNHPIDKWCVTSIQSEPFEFSSGSPLTAANKPKWGTCPE
jgi:surface protein